MYMINALIYRPGEGKAEPFLLESACQHVQNEVRITPIMYGRGLYFLSDIMGEGIYRLPDTRTVDSWVLEALYRREDILEIESEFDETRVHPAKKRKKTLKVRDGEGMVTLSGEGFSDSDREAFDHPSGEDEAPTISSAMIPIEMPIEMGSDDNEVEIASVQQVGTTLGGAEGPQSHLRRTVSPILRQFPSDIFQLAPSPKPGSGIDEWILLDPLQRANVDERVFKSFNLGNVFRQAQYRVMTPVSWKTLVFDRYFPPRGKGRGKLQNFPSAQYYMAWQALLDGLDKDQAEAARAFAFSWFDELLWVPHPESDRMWCTKPDRGKGARKTWTMVPDGESQACPHIARNPKQCQQGDSEPHGVMEM
jgi:hypothetical protein